MASIPKLNTSVCIVINYWKNRLGTGVIDQPNTSVCMVNKDRQTNTSVQIVNNYGRMTGVSVPKGRPRADFERNRQGCNYY